MDKFHVEHWPLNALQNARHYILCECHYHLCSFWWLSSLTLLLTLCAFLLHPSSYVSTKCRSMLLSEYYKNTLFIIAMKIKACSHHVHIRFIWCEWLCNMLFSPSLCFFLFLSFWWEIFHFLTIDVILPFLYIFFYSLLHFHTTHNIFLCFIFLFTLFCEFYEWS